MGTSIDFNRLSLLPETHFQQIVMDYDVITSPSGGKLLRRCWAFVLAKQKDSPLFFALTFTPLRYDQEE